MFNGESFVTAVYPTGTTTVNALMARVLCQDPGQRRTLWIAAQAYRVSASGDQWSVDASYVLKKDNVQIGEIPFRTGNNGLSAGEPYFRIGGNGSDRGSLFFRSESGRALGYDVFETEIPGINLDGLDFDQIDVVARKVVSTSAVNISVLFGARVLIL